jgi:hypothetical protein
MLGTVWRLAMRTAILAVMSAVMLLAATSCTKSTPPNASAKPLSTLEQALPAQLNAALKKHGLPGTWTGDSVPLPKEDETALHADDYLNLKLVPPFGGDDVQVCVVYYRKARSREAARLPPSILPGAGFKRVGGQARDVAIGDAPGKTVLMSVVLVEKADPPQKVIVFHYYNAGGTYRHSLEVPHIISTYTPVPAESFLSQTIIIIPVSPLSTGNPLSKDSDAYRRGTEVLNALVPLLEKDYYPDVGKAKN